MLNFLTYRNKIFIKKFFETNFYFLFLFFENFFEKNLMKPAPENFWLIAQQMGCLNQVDIKRRSLMWYTARIIAPLCEGGAVLFVDFFEQFQPLLLSFAMQPLIKDCNFRY